MQKRYCDMAYDFFASYVCDTGSATVDHCKLYHVCGMITFDDCCCAVATILCLHWHSTQVRKRMIRLNPDKSSLAAAEARGMSGVEEEKCEDEVMWSA